MSTDTNRQSIEPAPVFLIGMPRSGTKLLRDLLNKHPSIRIPDSETAILPMLVNEWQLYGDIALEKNFEKFFVRISQQFFFDYLKQRGRPMTVEKWRENIREYTPAGVFEGLVRADTENHYGTDIVWGDKSPSYINHVGLINDLYPSARIIHIVRDVRDYCLSISAAWGKNMYRASYRWGQSVSKACTDGDLLEGRYLQVHYEVLIESPELVLRNICSLLDLSFTPQMLTLEKPSENFGETRGQSIIVSTNKGKFDDRLTRKELKKIEELAFEGMLATGYEPRLATGCHRPLRSTLFLQRLLDGYHLSQAVRREHGFFRGVMLHFYRSRAK